MNKDKAAKEQAKAKSGKQGYKKECLLGIDASKEDDFADWYSQVITRGGLIEYYDISGCYILRPSSYAMWEAIKDFLDAKIKSIGVENCYFPMFVSNAALEKEKDHIEGFSPEVAWVTKSGQSEMENPIAIRPTSETVMYPSFAKWIQSHRDLPLLLNQWCNVVRWEFKNPQPFLRTREFLWQEGHTAHADKASADKEVYAVLDFYRAVYEEMLAVPVTPGIKTEKEKFAGGDFTTTVEGFIPSTGRGIQGATSHSLGQNFSKMFNIVYEDPHNPGQMARVWQNSWGLTTRTIGVAIMIHSDDKGLVLPPRVAQTQVAVVPIYFKGKEDIVDEACNKAIEAMRAAGIRCRAELDRQHTPGFKFNDCDLKGIPIHIEIGPRDVENGTIVAVRRDDGKKVVVKADETGAKVNEMLEQMQQDLFTRAKAVHEDCKKIVTEWPEMINALTSKCMALVPFCGEVDCEETIKTRTAAESESEDPTALSGSAKSLCVPLTQPTQAMEKCIQCGKTSNLKWTLFGRSY